MQIVDLHVRGDWVLVVFKNSFKLFNFAIGFEQNQVVAEAETQVNTAKSGKIAIYQVADESSICLAFGDSEKKGKVNLHHYDSKDYRLIKEKMIFVTDG